MPLTDTDRDPADPTPVRLWSSLRRLASTLVEIVETRVEIAANEFEEEREHIRELVLYGFVSLFFLAFGVILLTLFVVVVFWDQHRTAVLGGLAFAYLAIGGAAAAALRAKLKARPRLFAATLGELKKDRGDLGAGP